MQTTLQQNLSTIDNEFRQQQFIQRIHDQPLHRLR